MPRQPRQKSSTGIYHVMLRGINQQVIFEDNEDYSKFLETIEKYKTVSGYKIFAYCLMSNHIHLLLKVEKEDLDLIMKRIAGSYVYWYNWKYYRKGHLFQDRFKSEPVENDEYFFTVIRYIHQNPVKAEIAENVMEYRYSSYNDYVEGGSQITETEFALSIMQKEDFLCFNNESNEDNCLDVENINFRLSDNDAREVIKKISKCENSTEFQTLEPERRNYYIKKLRLKGMSIRQISRLTGISKGIVEKI